ncbi:unnamed protein product [Timema podura]|uniref:Uncharacterized protein n=1 Tax=Timema podura TaxID=61482 RepID=A0ABN7P2P3_TIMPD|nr:unnamed protein product [Timema podura]
MLHLAEKRNLQCACVTGCLLVMKPVYCAQDLTTDVQEYLAGYLRDVTQAMLQEPLDFLSECLHGALTSVAPKVEIFVELLGGCSNIKIRQIKEYYHKKFLGNGNRIYTVCILSHVTVPANEEIGDYSQLTLRQKII